MTLAPPATLQQRGELDVQLRLLSSAPHPLKDRARVHFHSYTMETVVEVVLFRPKDLDPAGARAQDRNFSPGKRRSRA